MVKEVTKESGREWRMEGRRCEGEYEGEEGKREGDGAKRKERMKIEESKEQRRRRC